MLSHCSVAVYEKKRCQNLLSSTLIQRTDNFSERRRLKNVSLDPAGPWIFERCTSSWISTRTAIPTEADRARGYSTAGIGITIPIVDSRRRATFSFTAAAARKISGEPTFPPFIAIHCSGRFLDTTVCPWMALTLELPKWSKWPISNFC